MNSGGPDSVVLHCLLYFSLRVAKAMMGAKVIIFVFRPVVCFLSRVRPPDRRPFLHLGNQAEISHIMELIQGEIGPGKRASPVNQRFM